MAESVDHVISKLKNDPVYRQMFFAAFGDNKVTSDRIYKALSQFLINLVSSNSKYDRVKRGEDQFSPEEQMGYAVFQAKCSTCHKEPLFTDFSYRNIGLPIDPSLNDYGRFKVTGNPADSFKFRTPSLRNNDFTSYYTHDGRFSLPRNVIQHYRSGIVPSSTLDPILIGGMTLTNTEENNLVFFLRTLSDSAFLNNSRFKE
jgi:cytochrome c peroxidase